MCGGQLASPAHMLLLGVRCGEDVERRVRQVKLLVLFESGKDSAGREQIVSGLRTIGSGFWAPAAVVLRVGFEGEVDGGFGAWRLAGCGCGASMSTDIELCG